MQWSRARWWTVVIVLALIFLAELGVMVRMSFPDSMVPGVANDRYGISFASDAYVRLGQAGVLDCLSILLGVVGCGLIAGALSRRPANLPPPLVLAALSAVCLGSFLLIGYDFAADGFDAEFSDIGIRWIEAAIAKPASLSVPAFREILDIFELAAMNLLVCVLLFGLAAGAFRLPAVAAVTLSTTIAGFPMAVAWTQRGADPFELTPLDSALAFPIHVLAGSAGFALIVGARILPPHPPGRVLEQKSFAGPRPDRWRPLMPPQMLVFALGFVFLLASIVRPSRFVAPGAGELVPRAFGDLTVLAIVAGGSSALLASLFLRRRSSAQCFAVGCLAGWAIVAAGAGEGSVGTSLALGSIAGVLAHLILYTLDRHRFDDPFGIVPAQLICGSLGALVAGLPALESGFVDSLHWPALLDQAGAVLVTGLLGFTIGGVVALAAWLTGTLWEPTNPCR